MGNPKLEMLTAQNSAVAAPKAAKIREVPTVLPSIWPEGDGEFIKEIADLFPGREVIARTVLGFDAFEDERVLQPVKKTGRKKIVFYCVSASDRNPLPPLRHSNPMS